MNQRDLYLRNMRRYHEAAKDDKFKAGTRIVFEQVLQMVDNTYQKFQHYHMEVITGLSAKELAAHDKLFAEVEDMYAEVNTIAKHHLQRLSNDEARAQLKELEQRERNLEAERKKFEEDKAKGSSHNSHSNMACATTNRIMRFIRSNKFDGNYTKWCEWKSSYEGLVHNTDLSTIEKFHTLKQSLTGDAASIISGWQIVADNYECAYEALKEVFDNDYRITMAHLDDLANIETHSSETHEGLRQLIDTTNRVVRQLQTTKNSENLFDYMLVHTLIHNMSPQTLEEWENSTNLVKMPTHSEVLKFLERRARSRVNLDMNSRDIPDDEDDKDVTESPQPSEEEQSD